ncbi:MFS transporter [Neolewinella antarctica]|uniref:MFS family permease n=1 Tax=Neolewinella antarctica TaxID=442734 RepID=A0ABX0XC48_9BACT|nr:MFS transporter [Neolewinella antarctica]NJC26782.1 MFS family permease [Neolewinella antarctica]
MFKNKFFLLFVFATFVSNVGTWLFAVGAGWLMTDLGSSALSVSLVQTASLLPMLLLAVPAGAVGDLYDRRRIVIASQAFLVLNTLLFAYLVMVGIASVNLLLFFTLMNGVGAAFAGPVMSAIIPQLVERDRLRTAMSFSSIAFNFARAVGPILGGLLIANYTIDLPFWIDALSYVAVIVVLFSWKYKREEEGNLPPEPLRLAMGASLRFLRYTPSLYNSILRSVLFFFSAGALWALMPLVARERLGGGADLYGYLLGAAGVGAVISGVLGDKITSVINGGPLIVVVSALMSAGLLAIGITDSEVVAIMATFIAGAAWQIGFTSLITSSQYALPIWYGARGMAFFIMAMSGSLAIGSALWGALSDASSLQTAYLAAAGVGALLIPLGMRFPLNQAENADLRAVEDYPVPKFDSEPTGCIRIVHTYELGEANYDEAVARLRKLRNKRYRAGALKWGLLSYPEDRTRLIEFYVQYSHRELERHAHHVTREDSERTEEIHQWLRERGATWNTSYFTVVA